MGTTLTGTTPQDTYDSLIKVTDNGPLSGSLKTLTDGLGNDSALALSTGGASITGTLAVSGNATFDTSTLVVDAANNRVGVGTATPSHLLDVQSTSATLRIRNTTAPNAGGTSSLLFEGLNDFSGVSQSFINSIQAGNSGATQLAFGTGTSGGATATERMRIDASGNVGIGTSSPATTLAVNGITSVLGGQQLRVYRTDNATYGSIQYLTGAGGFKFDDVNGDGYTFAQGGITKMSLTSSNVLDLAAGQIKFPATQVPSADPNTLDDYEEGTFTATLAPSTSGTITLSVNTCTYTKIGRQVTVKGFLTISSVASPVGTSVDIGGLPFTIINSTSGRGTFSFVVLDASTGYNAFTGPTQHTANSTSIIAYYDASTLAASDEIMFTATYFV